MLPLIESLERSPEWTGLEDDINDLERLRYPRRRVENEERRNRLSAPMMETGRAASKVSSRPHEQRSFVTQTPVAHRWSWRPKTDFERSYFLEEYANDVENGGRSLDHRQEQEYKASSCVGRQRRQEESMIPWNDEGALVRRSPISVEREAKAIATTTATSDSSSFSGSRERLREIFEHNRYLRRRFFGAPEPDSPSTTGGQTGAEGRCKQQQAGGAGFGSTETLTSQSNQSSVSSVNGRKSQGKSNSPDFPEEIRRSSFDVCRAGNDDVGIARREDGRVSKSSDGETSTVSPATDGITSELDDGNAWDRVADMDNRDKTVDAQTIKYRARKDRASDVSALKNLRRRTTLYLPYVEEESTRESTDSDSLRLLELRLKGRKILDSTIFSDGSSRGENDSKNALPIDHRSMTSRIDEARPRNRNPISPGVSMPELSSLDGARGSSASSFDIARVSVDGRTVDCPSKNGDPSTERNDGKYRASCVRITSPEADRGGSGSSTLSKRSKWIPPPLDLTRVKKCNQEDDNRERRGYGNRANDPSDKNEDRMLVRVAILRDYDRPMNRDSVNVVDLKKTTLPNGGKIRRQSDVLSGDASNRTTESLTNGLREDRTNLRKGFWKSTDAANFNRGADDFLPGGLNKSCGDLSAPEDLLSPRLVNDYENSVIDLRSAGSYSNDRPRSSRIVDLDYRTKRETVARTPASMDDRRVRPVAAADATVAAPLQSGTGSTITSTVYGPIPYSQ